MRNDDAMLGQLADLHRGMGQLEGQAEERRAQTARLEKRVGKVEQVSAGNVSRLDSLEAASREGWSWTRLYRRATDSWSGAAKHILIAAALVGLVVATLVILHAINPNVLPAIARRLLP
ncbi:MAG: hypothetical protein AAGJ10_21170 [Bacteroidota bacterium]